MPGLLSVALHREHDVVLARQRARQLAALLGFDTQDTVRVATAVSEIARNAYEHGGGGRVEFAVEGLPPTQRVEINVVDGGPGIPQPGEAAGRGRGLGIGMVGAQRLMDAMEVHPAPGGGTRVMLAKRLPTRAPVADAASVARIVEELSRQRPPEPVEEVHAQNRELVVALAELRERQEELARLNRELEDTNRGVVALYTELEERADQLRRANRLQAQFLSYVSHEFRTPLDAMLALGGLLLDRVDGPLTDEQETQVRFLRSSAADLLQMVDELLDTARMESGQAGVRTARFWVADLFSALRATFRPLHSNPAVALVFEDAEDLPELCTDEAKVSQILRNLVSNALKFTQRGEVRVSAARSQDGSTVRFRVADTGIGIPKEHRERIFEDFAQVESAVQRRVRGTGLGLPLSRRFAELLGGTLALEGLPEGGSIFVLTIPIMHPECDARPDAAE